VISPSMQNSDACSRIRHYQDSRNFAFQTSLLHIRRSHTRRRKGENFRNYESSPSQERKNTRKKHPLIWWSTRHDIL
jgi:hypothetical protein